MGRGKVKDDGGCKDEGKDSEEEVFKPKKPPARSKARRSTDSAQNESRNSYTSKATKPLEEQKDTCEQKQTTFKEELFCPICQIPLSLLKISPAMHTANCNIPGNLPACPAGYDCLNLNIFHYRDYAHHALAAFRVSEDYIEPDVIFTPEKAKIPRTPLRTSGGKKRPSKSPAASSCKVPKKEEAASCAENLSPELPLTSVPSKKKLPFSDKSNRLCSDDPTVDDPLEYSPLTGQNSEPVLESELWCSDLALSGGSPEQLPAQSVKIESEAQNGLTENINVSSSAKVSIEYTDSVKDQNILGSQVECTQSCHQSTEPQDSLQANCSVIFKANGVSRDEAMARSPVSVTLMLNKSGWEAVEIKGAESTIVQNLTVSLCKCSHSIHLECSVHNKDLSSDVKFNANNQEQKEKFFSTMAEMGLKSQFYVQPLHDSVSYKRNALLAHCNQLTVSSLMRAGTNPFDENEFVSDNENSVDNTSTLSKNVLGKKIDHAPTKNAFALLKNSATVGRRPSTPSTPTPSANNSRSSTPTPVPMVVSKSTKSSWTLVPSKESTVKGKATWGQTSVAKKVPAYKRIPDTPFAVDAFNFGIIPGVQMYFLSHFHSDHYIGLRKDFNKPIFCSQVTANLVHMKIKVDKKYLFVLKKGEPRVVCGVEVEIFDANHCPGAVMFLFRLLDGRVFLHVGDFRAHTSMEELTQLQYVDKLYLDTTYCDPSYDFPLQEDVVNKVVQTASEHLVQNKATLFACGTYTIGKEKVFMALAEKFNLKIWCSGEKRRVLQCLEDKNILDRLTNDQSEAQIHVMNMRDISLEELSNHLSKFRPRYTRIVGFKPTGWTTSTSIKGKPSDFQKSSRGNVTIYGVPYSEHSSFSELRQFVRFVQPKDIQVTVNLSKTPQYKKMFQQWLSTARDDNQSKMMQYFATSS